MARISIYISDHELHDRLMDSSINLSAIAVKAWRIALEGEAEKAKNALAERAELERFLGTYVKPKGKH